MSFVLAALAGMLAGLVYFGGLWLTVRRLTRTGARKCWLHTSGLARLLLLGIVFQALSRDGPGTLLAGLAGLWLARGYLIYRIGAVL
jgi:F1F0 ATPase subunit 2